MYDFLNESSKLLHRAGELGGIDPAVIELLEEPMRVYSFRIPMKMDDGSRRVFQAYRARHNDAIGPSRDGTRISPDLDLNEVKALSLLMSVKHAAGNIPAGGGKGGVVADPRKLSKWEYERLCRAFIRFLYPKGSDRDVPGADIGTDLQSMAWMLDELEQITGRHQPAAINDKPAILGGSLGAYDATGCGVFDATVEALREQDQNLDGLTVAIQGCGQVGAVAADLFAQAGAKVIAVSDSRHAVYNAGGLDIPALRTHKQETGSVKDFAGADALTNAELLTSNCDILIPAAVQGVIDHDNAAAVQASMIVEAANGPTTSDADAILNDKGIPVVPDIIANSGSVHVCQMERTQGLSDDAWPLSKVNQLRHDRLVAAYRAARATATQHKLKSTRIGAWINALEKIQDAIKMRGWL